MCPSGTISCLRDRSVPPDGPGDNPFEQTDVEAGDAEDRWLICVVCATPITTESARVEVEGAHVHTRTNPAAETFRIGCFCHAPGSRAVGAPSTFWTWFPPLAWRAVVCLGCESHLGWGFGEGDSGFVGLILNRLRVGPTRSLS